MPPPKLPAAHVEWAKYLRAQVPGDAVHVRLHYDEAERNRIAIFTSENAQGIVAATIGFYIVKDGWRVAPGVTFADMVGMYAPELAAKHVVFVPPFQWDDGRLTKVALADRTVYPLLAVPITDGELRLVRDYGVDELQDRWERQSTDALDWGRAGIA